MIFMDPLGLDVVNGHEESKKAAETRLKNANKIPLSLKE